MRTVSGPSGKPARLSVEPARSRSVRAVSLVTAPSTDLVSPVTAPAVGSRPSRTVAWPAAPDCASRVNRGGSPSGRGSEASRASRLFPVRTPYADSAGSARSGPGSSAFAWASTAARASGRTASARAASGRSRPGGGAFSSSTVDSGEASVTASRSPSVSYASTARGRTAARNAVTSTSTPKATAAQGAVRSRVRTHGAPCAFGGISVLPLMAQSSP